MALKLLKGIWFLSMLIALITLLYVYAILPVNVVVHAEGGSSIALSNDVFFYLVMALMALINVLVYIIAKLYRREEDLRTWFYGLITTINIFFIIGLGSIAVYNSQEKFNLRIDLVLYGSLILIALWSLSWPVAIVLKRIKAKQLN